MKTAHTQGRWDFAPTGKVMRDEYSQPYGIAVVNSKNLIAGCFGTVKGGEETARANAQLMAMAPELLDALKKATESLKVAAEDSDEAGYPERAESIRADVHAYRAIIAKSKGQ